MGANGQFAMALLEEEFKTHPERVWKSIEGAWARSLGADFPGQERAWRIEEILERTPFATYRTMIRFMWSMGAVLEHLRRAGDPSDREKLNLHELHMARAQLELIICAGEQATLDGGSWDLGWLWTHCPEPPFHKIAAVKPERKLNVHACGIDKRYVAAGLAYLRDEDAIINRRQATGKKKDEEKKGGGKSGGGGGNVGSGDKPPATDTPHYV